jgi:hypothetical protein
LISSDAPITDDKSKIFSHMESLIQKKIKINKFEIIDGYDRNKPISIGSDDLFLATAWWTAQIVREVLRGMRYKKFFYLIQDFEPILYAGSTFHARAYETYSFDFIPIINTKILYSYFVKEKIGNFRKPGFLKNVMHFEPAISSKHYFLNKKNNNFNIKKKTLLFYARPTMAQRNLFEIGLASLRRLAKEGVIDSKSWEVLAIGENINPVNLSDSLILQPIPWMSFDDYAKKVRSSDLMLSLMYSPHPSYAPLEMAASGNIVITNTFSSKNKKELQKYSPNILAVSPNVDDISQALKSVIADLNLGIRKKGAHKKIALPDNWNESFRTIIEKMSSEIKVTKLFVNRYEEDHSLCSASHVAKDYEVFKTQSLAFRRFLNGRAR